MGSIIIMEAAAMLFLSVSVSPPPFVNACVRRKAILRAPTEMFDAHWSIY